MCMSLGHFPAYLLTEAASLSPWGLSVLAGPKLAPGFAFLCPKGPCACVSPLYLSGHLPALRLAFHVDAADSNSGPCGRAVSTLQTELSLQPPGIAST